MIYCLSLSYVCVKVFGDAAIKSGGKRTAGCTTISMNPDLDC